MSHAEVDPAHHDRTCQHLPEIVWSRCVLLQRAQENRKPPRNSKHRTLESSAATSSSRSAKQHGELATTADGAALHHHLRNWPHAGLKWLYSYSSNVLHNSVLAEAQDSGVLPSNTRTIRQSQSGSCTLKDLGRILDPAASQSAHGYTRRTELCRPPLSNQSRMRVLRSAHQSDTAGSVCSEHDRVAAMRMMTAFIRRSGMRFVVLPRRVLRTCRRPVASRAM